MHATRSQTVSAFVFFAAALVLFVGLGFTQQPKIAEASNDISSYDFATVLSSNASSTAPYVIKRGDAHLGSIIIASSSAARIRVYDGTATSTGTLIADIVANADEQVFTFDVGVQKGIVFDVPSTHNGAFTVTFRD